jgi:hypothetical protein
MKINSIATSSLVVLSLLLTAAGAYAQTALEAHVPFAFKVGKTQMPAGNYAIANDTDTNFITIRNLKTNDAVLALGTRQSHDKTTDKLVFRHVGDQYSLTEIWGDASEPGMYVAAPKQKKQLEAASAPSSPSSNIEIALK